MRRTARLSPAASSARDSLPATARLRAQILIAPSGEALVAMFAEAMAEHGIAGHFCVRGAGAALQPVLGDAPELIQDEARCLVVEAAGPMLPAARVLLAQPSQPLTPAADARVRGFSALYAARALALQELEDDVETACGLSLRERYVLGRRLAGLAPIDMADETGLSLATVSAALDSAVARLQVETVAAAIALAARRGWLAVTSLENCSSSSENITYKATQNG